MSLTNIEANTAYFADDAPLAIPNYVLATECQERDEFQRNDSRRRWKLCHIRDDGTARGVIVFEGTPRETVQGALQLLEKRSRIIAERAAV